MFYTFICFILNDTICYNSRKMSGKKKKEDKTIFETIRKPTAPPTKQIGQNKPESKIHPVNRKAKHKKKDDSES